MKNKGVDMENKGVDMEKIWIHIQMPESVRQRLLEAVKDISDEEKREIVANIIRVTAILPVECVPGKDELLLKGPAQHQIHQISH